MSLSRLARGTARLIFRTSVGGIATFLTLHYVGGFVVCYGPSMEPTLKTGNILLTDHVTPLLGWVDVGDIIVAKSPEGKGSNVCKRVVAMSGDTVKFNGKWIRVPTQHVWLEGDNKDNSNDSRDYGPVPLNKVRGRCFCKIWPEFDFGTFTKSAYLQLQIQEKLMLDGPHPASNREAPIRSKLPRPRSQPPN